MRAHIYEIESEILVELRRRRYEVDLGWVVARMKESDLHFPMGRADIEEQGPHSR